MAVIKCKMCGGDLNLIDGLTVAECEYCGSRQTVPTADDEKKLTLFARANRLRAACEFDKAAVVYETIVSDFPEEAESYWGLVLCKYGIEYVDDPATGKKIPTCHRSSFDSIMSDSDFEQALENADVIARKVYREEAKQIEEIRKGIVAVSNNERPYDIFICYKETDEKGERTLDSVLAQDIYDALTTKGYRVFFSRITLEDKLGVEYEPYIFAALNSAKIMLVMGTDYEYFDAVWVKNEWSRFLKLMAKDKGKHLIPCYKGIDAYDMPREFAKLQAQDMGKIGAMQDLLRGIEKILSVKKETIIVQSSADVKPFAGLMKRAAMFIEEGNWDGADACYEKILDADPECAEGYIGKLMIEFRASNQEALKNQQESFHEHYYYQKAIRFADDALRATLNGYIDHINIRNENARLQGIYAQAKSAMDKAQSEKDYHAAAEIFETIAHFENAGEMAEICRKQAEEIRKDEILAKAKKAAGEKNITGYREAYRLLKTIPDWRNSDKLAEDCHEKIALLEEKAEAERKAKKQREEAERIKAAARAKRNRKIAKIAVPALCAVIAATILLTTLFRPVQNHDNDIILQETVPVVVPVQQETQMPTEIVEQTEPEEEPKRRFIDRGQYLFADNALTACVREDGTAVATGGDSQHHRIDAIKSWDNIKKLYHYNESFRTNNLAETAALKMDGTLVSSQPHWARSKDVENWTDIVKAVDPFFEAYETLFAPVGLKEDGTLVMLSRYEGRCFEFDEYIKSQTDIVDFTMTQQGNKKVTFVGLKSDGTVVAVSKVQNKYQSFSIELWDVDDWTDVISIHASTSKIVGLRADGTVVALESPSDNWQEVIQNETIEANTWTDICAIHIMGNSIIGIKNDGTVVVDNAAGIPYLDEVKTWADIVDIRTSYSSKYPETIRIVGLRSDGTVVAAGQNDIGQCDVGDWTDIIWVELAKAHTVGLKADGTVVATGNNRYGQCDVGDWTDIAAVRAGPNHTVGIKFDGTAVAVGDNSSNLCNVENWTNLKLSE